MKVNDPSQQSKLHPIYASQTDQQSMHKHFQALKSSDDCIYHPGPQVQILPSGLNRQSMIKFNESPQQAQRDLRTELRAKAQHENLTRPAICKDHDFCLANVPQSPTEQEQLSLRGNLGFPQTSSQSQSLLLEAANLSQPATVLTQGVNKTSNANIQMLTVSFNLGMQQSQSVDSRGLMQFDARASSLDEIRLHEKQDSFDDNLSGIHDHASQEHVGDAKESGRRQLARAIRDISGDRDNSLALISPCRKPLIDSKSALNPWEKVVVTKEEYDNWITQLYGHNIKNFPKVQPPNMPDKLFKQLKKLYVTPLIGASQNPSKKKNSKQEIKVESRYMNWQKKQARQVWLKAQKDGTKERHKSLTQSMKDLPTKVMEELSSTIQDGLSQQANFIRMAGARLDQDQGTRQPRSNDLLTAVFNKNARVDNLVSEIDPTDEQLAKQAALLEQQARAKEERKEHLRLELIRKTKVALSHKQKVHALKLYHVLGGIVSRKEIEQTAFRAHGLQRVESAASHIRLPQDVDEQPKRAQSVMKSQVKMVNIVKENSHPNLQLASSMVVPSQHQGHDAYVTTPSPFTKVHNRINKRSNLVQNNDKVMRRSGTSQAPSWHLNPAKSRPSTSKAAICANSRISSSQMLQKHPIKFSYNSVTAQQSKQESHSEQLSNNKSNQPQKRIYKVWGVSSQKILNKRAVQSRPFSTMEQIQCEKDMSASDRDATTRMTTSVSNLGRPPTAKTKSKVVNARSTAAKLVLRNVGRQQSAEHIRRRSSSIGESESIRQVPPSALKRSNENSLAFMGQYLQQDVDQQSQNKLQSSLMRARASRDTLQSTEQLNQQNSVARGDLSTPFDSIEPIMFTAMNYAGNSPQLIEESQEIALSKEIMTQFVPKQVVGRRRIQSNNVFNTEQCDRKSSKNDYKSIKLKDQPGHRITAKRQERNLTTLQTIKPEITDSSIFVLPSPKVETAAQEDLNHVLEHTEKHRNADMLKSLVTKKGETINIQEKETERNLSKIQPCSALFRKIQGEFNKVQIDNKQHDMDREHRLAQYLNLDKVNFVSQKKQDSKLLEALIDGKHDTNLVKQRVGNSQKAGQHGARNCLELMAKEQLTTFPSASSSVMQHAAASAKKRTKSGLESVSHDVQSISEQELKEESEDEDENAELYRYDEAYELELMLKDESEDEESQSNFEINQHKSAPFVLDESHKYRNEIKDSFYFSTGLTPEEKIKQVNNIRDADFWLQKGIAMTAHNQLSTAIQCYKQTLLLNDEHYVAMYNLAVCYERRDKYSSALKWFKRAAFIKPTMHSTFIGAAVNLFKLGQFEKAEAFVRAGIEQVKKLKIQQFGSLEHIEEEDVKPFQRDKSQTFQALINDYQYILTLCLRKLRKFEEADKLYLSNAQFYRYSERYDMVLSIFGLLLLPMQTNRRSLADEIETIHDNLQLYKGMKNPIQRPLLGTYYSKNKWHLGLAEHAAEELRQRSFFKRFSIEDIVRLLPKMTVKQYQPERVIFPDFDVCIILSGLVESKFHTFGDRIPKPLAKYGEGDILGFVDGDAGNTAHVETWSISRSHVEVIWMHRQDFAKLWQIQQRDQKKMLCQIVRMQKCFQSCNELTIHMIAFELLTKRYYKPGEKILRTAKRSIVNYDHKASLEEQTNLIQKRVLIQLKEEQDLQNIRGGTGARLEIRHSDKMWQLMLRKIAGEAKEEIGLVLARMASLRKSTTFTPQAGLDKDIDKTGSMGALMDHQAATSIVGTHDSPLKRKASQEGLQFRSKTSVHLSDKKYKQHYVPAGLFIIETGNCKIVLKKEDGSQSKIVACIARNDSFGASQSFKLQTLDYLGDIVAGGEIERFTRGKKDLEMVKEVERNVVCWYLPVEALRRIPEFELKTARSTLQQQNMPFVQIAARKYSTTVYEQQKKLVDLQLY